jgi:lipopolysaccharide/colanic/teichoic acid biosynthesis glycosyltransferase
MEPDILASPSDAPVGESWSPPATPQGPVRSTNGNAVIVARRNGGALTNGHSSPIHGHGVMRPTIVARIGAPTNGAHHPGGPVGPAWAGASSGGADAEVLAPFDAVRDEGPYLRYGKRILDVIGASIALLCSLPILAAAALAIRIESPGPIFYRSIRIGRNGRPFTFLKLRSMVRDADRHRHQLSHLNEVDGPAFKISRDPRVTRVGRFLRTTSIDEIPQFVNVLRGEMSLVGPRPPIPEEVAQYEPWQLRRLDVRPGITCLWQISGRSRIGFQEWMRLDLEYIRYRSFALDLKILLRTLPAVLSREGAY